MLARHTSSTFVTSKEWIRRTQWERIRIFKLLFGVAHSSSRMQGSASGGEHAVGVQKMPTLCYS